MAAPATGVPPHPIIGILGGMGPDATLDLMQRVLAATPARADEDHIHLIIDNNPKVPSRIAAIIEGTGEDPTPELVRMAKGLEASGATALAIACNTAHAYAGPIAAAVRIPLLDMVSLTTAQLAGMDLPRRKVGLLASTAVRIVGLYERNLAPYGIELVYPERQQELMSVIKAVKGGDKTPGLRAAFAGIADELAADAADVLLVACTELSLLADSLRRGPPAVDAVNVLVEGIVACGLGQTMERPKAASSR